MRPRSKRVGKTSIALWAIILILVVVVLLLFSRVSISSNPESQPSLSTTVPLPKKSNDVPFASLLSKVRLFMVIHNVSMSGSLPQPPGDAGLPSEVAKYMEECVNNLDATPDSVLMYHFNVSEHGELASLNAEAERELLDDGYAQHVARSQEFWDPMQSLRRGYGSEGSVFVVLPFAATAQDIYKLPTSTQAAQPPFPENAYVHAGCASTVRSLFQNARWPIGVSVATPQLIFTRTAGENRTVERVVGCFPPEFGSQSEEQSYGFAYKDNMRSRSVVIPLPTGRPYSESDVGQQSARLSSSHAMRFALMQLYRGESYVLFTNPGVVLAPGWDWTTKLLYLQLPERGRAVLTSRGMGIEQALAESYIAELRAVASEDRGVPINTATATAKGRQLKAAIDSDSFTVARMVTPTWLHPFLDKMPGQEVTSQPSESSVSLVSQLRALLTPTSDAVPAGDASLGLKIPSLPPSMVLEIIGRAVGSTNEFPTEWSSSDAEWLSDDRVIDKAQLERAWLMRHREQLRKALALRMKQWTFTNVVSAASTPISSHTGRVEEDVLVEVSTSMVGRQSHSLSEVRYLRPGDPKSSLPLSSEMWTLGHTYQGTTASRLPYMAGLVGSTDFLFTRAEAFVQYETDDMLQFDPSTQESPGEAIKLDPFLGLLSSDEEDVFLSAKLWTNGWNLFAPTEAVAFVARSNPATLAPKTPDASGWGSAPNFMRELRERTVARWRLFFSCVQDQPAGCVKELGGAQYTAGTVRGIRDYLKWTGVTV